MAVIAVQMADNRGAKFFPSVGASGGAVEPGERIEEASRCRRFGRTRRTTDSGAIYAVDLPRRYEIRVKTLRDGRQEEIYMIYPLPTVFPLIAIYVVNDEFQDCLGSLQKNWRCMI